MAEGTSDEVEGTAARTEAEIEPRQRAEDVAEVAVPDGCVRRRGGRRLVPRGSARQQGAGELKPRVHIAGGKEAMMAHLDEAFWQDVQDEAAKKLLGLESDLGVAACAESDAARIESDEAMIADADAMGVLTEVAKDLVLVAEGRFAVDDPSNAMEPVEETAEAVGVSEGSGGPIETELSVAVSTEESIEQLSPKERSERTDGKEVMERSGDPSLHVDGQAASGDDAVEMRVKAQVASPGVEHGGDTELGAEPSRIARKVLEGSGRAGEERVEDEVSIDESESAELPGQREDDVESVGGEHTRHALLDPASLSDGLALGTVPVSTGVVGERLDVTAGGADVLVPSELGGPAPSDVAQDGLLLGRESVSAREGVAVSADDVRDLQRWPVERAHARRGTRGNVHGALAESLFRASSAEDVNGTLDARDVLGRDACVAERGGDGGMSEEHLNDADIGAELEQVRGK